MSANRDFFNSAAQDWHSRRRPDVENADIMLRLSCLRPGLRILDAGCGAGFLTPFLLQSEPERIIGVDYAENMIRAARENCADPRTQFICRDITLTGQALPDCDFCVCYNSFPHFSDPAAAVENLARAIVPGGRLTVSHTQGKRTADGAAPERGTPAAGLVRLMEPYFRLDAVIDSNAMFLVSGIRYDMP
ncbi:MAG: class I SAM-dependent methyltransferase [Oscillospiraceae bacterium]|nr:class I SAM-dependent methyltransferase [Oscillospiraceae bacterium]